MIGIGIDFDLLVLLVHFYFFFDLFEGELSLDVIQNLGLILLDFLKRIDLIHLTLGHQILLLILDLKLQTFSLVFFGRKMFYIFKLLIFRVSDLIIAFEIIIIFLFFYMIFDLNYFLFKWSCYHFLKDLLFVI